jgi:hypothetical protein
MALVVFPYGAAGYSLLPISAFVLSLIITLRTPFGLEGSDQMILILTGSLIVSSLVPAAAEIAALFIGAQLCLAYVTAGVAKLASPEWRTGTALVAVMATQSYGHPGVARLLATVPLMSFLTSWMIMVWEATVPLCLVLPLSWAAAILVCGVLFHLTNAIVMGLNNFAISFLAGYPALIWMIEHADQAWR